MFEVFIKKCSWELLLAFPMWEMGNLGQKMMGLVGGTGELGFGNWECRLSLAFCAHSIAPDEWILQL